MGGKGGGERREGGGSTARNTQVHNRHTQTQTTQEKGKNTTRGIGDPKVVQGRSPDIFQGGVGGLYIQ